jgi:hypothetical protein
MLWRRKHCKLLTHSDRWTEWQEQIEERFQELNVNMPASLTTPPRLYLASDNEDLFRIRDEIARILANPFTDTTGDEEAGFTDRVGNDVVVVILETLWRGFIAARTNDTAIVVHELAHVEEQRKFGAFPAENRIRSCRLIWAEFFAEQMAARLYGPGRGGFLANSLIGAITRGEIDQGTFKIGRLLGFCHGFRYVNLEDYWQLYPGVSPACQDAAGRLWPLLKDAFQANQLPDLERIYEALDPLLNQ